MRPDSRPAVISPAPILACARIDVMWTDDADPDEVDPERLRECAYWRCGELFEARSVQHRFCRKACRSRQHKWQRAQDRRLRRATSANRTPDEL